MTELSTKIIRELLDYDPLTGTFTWRHRALEWFKTDREWKRWNNRYAGKAAGSVKKNNGGYPRWDICVLGKNHRASRLTFIWMGEPLPEQVDHANGNSLDNRWANLLASTASDNQKNRSKRRDNTSGVTGVYWHKAAGKWQARVNLGGKTRHLGLFSDINDAAAAIATFYAANGFTARHGQSLSAYQQA